MRWQTLSEEAIKKPSQSRQVPFEMIGEIRFRHRLLILQSATQGVILTATMGLL